MPQEINLNVNPYFDDFDKDKNYYRVLFKPGIPVQARELSTLQSILQNQIEQFGTHFFKEGSKVIPGNLTYDNNFQCVELEPTFLGVPVSLYLDKLVGIRLTGARSGVTATIKKILTADESDRGNITLYINYEKSSADDFSTQKFLDGENLLTDRDIAYGLSVIAANEPIASTIAFGAASTGSAMSVGEGVYFLRGTFVQVLSETLILEQYRTDPSFRVGFNVSEELITADEDGTLNDNASGFTNFAAPGADRLKISVNLSKKTLGDTNDQNFVEIARVEGGILRTFVKDTQYNLIRDSLAQRTYDESGDYYVKPFELFAKESLNNQIGNKGVYTAAQKTQQGGTPSDDLMLIQVSPGKAYVKGYDVEKISSNFIDVPKPRTTAEVEEESVSYSTGSPLFINNVFGSPSLGIGTTSTVSLLSTRRAGLTTVGLAPGGEEIGLARLYDFKAQSSSYLNEGSEYELRVFDVKTFTKLTVGTAITSVTASDTIEGARSGATGFVVTGGSDLTDLTLIDSVGTFLKDEAILINGVSNGRVITKVTDFNINDVKSLRSAVGVSTFEADVVLNRVSRVNNAISNNFQLANTAGNTGIITAAGSNFAGIVTTGNIISYTVPGNTTPTFNRVVGVATNGTSIDVQGITTVPNVCQGGVPAGTTNLTDLVIRNTTFEVGQNSLVTPLNRLNIESFDVTDTTIQLRKQYSDLTVSGGSFTSPNAGANLFFQPFDEERYFISYDDGTIEPLKSSQMTLAADSKTVTFVGLSKASGKANLFATVQKAKVTNKQKKINEANVIVIGRSKLTSSGIGTNTLNDGLTYSRVYGTRVQDRKISLNVPEAVRVLGIFESKDATDPDLPSLTLGSYSGPSGNNTDLIVGEQLIGLESNAVAVVVEKPNVTAVGVVRLNQNQFVLGETVRASKSGVTAILAATTRGDKNVTNQFTLNINDQSNFYDFSFIERKKSFGEPTNRLKVVFKNFFVTSDDTGDMFTASSYPSDTKNLINFNEDYNILTSDLVDIRPRVSAYSTSSTTSPFDFRSRVFSDQGNSIPDPFVPDEALIVNYNYYLPRKDRLYLDKDGQFTYLTGVPADNPVEPPALGESLEIAKIELDAYVYSMRDVSIKRTKHKRFTMADIGRLEKRLESVEYYTRLSLLETDTANLQITDANGLNRFKSGFFVDNFKSHDAHQIGHPDFGASIDKKEGYLRPSHYTTAIDLIVGSQSYIGIGTTANPTLDVNFLDDLDGQNVKKTGRLLTLNYNEVPMITQVYASRVENLNPFLIVYYAGDLTLNPDSDIWMDTKRLDANIIRRTSEYDSQVAILGIDTQTGLSEVDWGAWETNWTSERVELVDVRTQFEGSARLGEFERADRVRTNQRVVSVSGSGGARSVSARTTGFETTQTFQDIEQSQGQSRDGIQYRVTPTEQTESLGDRLVSRDIIPYMRSRNIELISTRMKPRTRFYAFFDGIDVTTYVTPKLIEVTMDTGLFQTGETVYGYTTQELTAGDEASFSFRLASPNHKEGPYNAPTGTYSVNPYNNAAGISTVYSTSSTLLNVDTFSLATQVQGSYYGRVQNGMKLKGQTSGAEATVSNLRLVADSIGNLRGSFYLPDPNVDANPRWETGTKTLRLTTSSINSTVGGTVTGSAESNFYAQGELQTVQENVLSIKVPQIERLSVQDQRVIQNRIQRPVTRQEITAINQDVSIQYYDPLAQTFRVDETSGAFVTSVDVYLRDKDDELPVTMQVRTVETGLPTSKVLPFSIVVKEPSEVNTSEDASIPTRFTFPSPVFLSGEQEYAIVLVTPSENYTAWISRMGEVDISTANLPEEQQVLISQQPYLGSLFKSQNGTTWDPSQYEDLKFTLYKAQFDTTPGTGRFFNPDLSEGNNQIIKLEENGIEILSRKAVVGFGTTFASPAGFIPGVTITQDGNLNASAKLLNTAGIASVGSQTFSIVNPGAGYTPSSGSLVYSNVTLPTLTGSGSGMVGDVTVNNGQISAVSVTNGGKNFAVGDTVGVGTVGLGNGSGAVLAVGIITSTNTIIIDQIQGSFNTGVGTITFNNGSTVELIGVGCTIDSFDVDSTNDGLHFKVNHRSHGMHAFNNLVTISGVESDVATTTLSADYTNTSTDDMQVGSSSNFDTFEGVGVGTTNYGYLKIGNEIISYNGTASGTITGITTRGVDNTQSFTYPAGTEVKKYEFGGVSLRRINKTHDMNDPAVSVPNAKTLDYYHLKVDMNSNGTDRSGGTLPDRFFTSTKRDGGRNIKATQNIQFETLTPNITTMTPPGTSVGARVRTITATSISGSEESFVDKGFEVIDIAGQNHFSSPRMIASKVNEGDKLSALPGNKSMTFEVNLFSNDPNVSPVIDLDRASVVATTNRLDSPVSNFATNNLVNVTGQDPVSASYVSKMIVLENPASELLVEFAAYRRNTADIRVFYKVISEGSTGNTLEQNFELFPGFANIDENDNIINRTNNNGTPDRNVTPSVGSEFKDYRFTSKELPPFTKFQLKIDMTGTSQAAPPLIKDLRAIALA